MTSSNVTQKAVNSRLDSCVGSLVDLEHSPTKMQHHFKKNPIIHPILFIKVEAVLKYTTPEKVEISCGQGTNTGQFSCRSP